MPLTNYNRETINEKSIGLEQEARQAKEQLTELARTATEYSNMIQKKEDQITHLVEQLDMSKSAHAKSLTEIIELQSDIDILVAELEAEKGDRAHETASRKKLQGEVDELRSLMEAKSSEETRRNEVETRKEEELAGLRSEVTQLHQDLAETRRLALDAQSKLKLELEYSVRERNTLQQSHKSLSEKERAAQAQLTKTLSSLSDLEKTNRTIDSELQSVRSLKHDYEGQLAEAKKAKEV
jgi:myosin protein heavy chain